MEKQISEIAKVKCVIGYPKNFEKDKKYPTIIMLNGAGSRGNKISVLEKESIFFNAVEKFDNFPFVVFMPLCEENTWFDMYERILNFVDDAINSPFVDKKRVYAMGSSMGGYCTWQLGMSIPEKLAAIAPICGGGMYWNARRFINVPVWAFHGELDGAVKVEESMKMVDKINAIGGNAKLTIYKDTYHDAWTPTYNNKELYDWFLSHENNNDKVIEDPYIDPKNFG